MRIRKAVDVLDAIRPETSFVLCFKSSGDLVREEVQLKITEERYEELLKLVDGKPIMKDYLSFDLYGLELERSSVDKEDELNGFMYAEIEFKSIDLAENADKLIASCSILGREVTHDSSYKMRNYWLRTRCS